MFIGIVVTVTLLVAQEAASRTRAVRERDSERRERMRLEGLSELARQLSAALGPRDIAAALENHVLREVGAAALMLGLATPDGRRLEWVSMVGYAPEILAEFGSGVALEKGYVATDSAITGQPVLIRTPEEYESRYGAGVRWLRARLNDAAPQSNSSQ